MTQQQLFKGRDKRHKGWFWMDNDYLNGYAKIFGADGTAIYVSLCRHANNETQKCFPAMELIAEELGIHRNTVSKYIKTFEKHHLISIGREKDLKSKKWLNNVYTLLDKEEWDSHAQILGMDSHAQLKKEPRTNNIDNHAKPLGNKETHLNNTHIKETNNIATQGVAGKEINDLIDLFKGVNPSWERLFANKTQRAATERLLQKMPREELENLINYLPQTNSQKYAPVITTPAQLEYKLGDLMFFIRKQENDKKNNTPIII